MRRALFILFLVGCGDDGGSVMPDGNGSGMIDMAEQLCLPQGAVGQFYRRQPNPRMLAGHAFGDTKVDTELVSPDLLWNAADSTWHLYYVSQHAASFAVTGTQVIRHATSTDLATWTHDDAPSLEAPSSGGAWDTYFQSVSVAIDPAAPADHRYVMIYSGATTLASYPHASIGMAHSADGKTFTRDGEVLTGTQVFAAANTYVTDPELVIVGSTYHLWFTAVACSDASCTAVDKRGIGHATSTNGTSWQVENANVPTLNRMASDPKTGGQHPTVVYDAPHCRWEMWLSNDSPATENDNQPTELENSVGLWHATSTNATSWTISYTSARDFVWDGTAAGEHLGMRAGADIALKGTGRYLVYTGYDDQNVPTNATLPTRSGTTAGVMTLDLATRDAPP